MYGPHLPPLSCLGHEPAHPSSCGVHSLATSAYGTQMIATEYSADLLDRMKRWGTVGFSQVLVRP